MSRGTLRGRTNRPAIEEMGMSKVAPDVAERYRRAGYPRPVGWAKQYRLDGDPTKAYPVPWINGEHGAEGDFYSFREDMTRAHEERLCCICGDQLGSVVAIGAYNGERATSGGWGHPRCIKMAVRFCPHFAEMQGTVAWMHVGPGVGVNEPLYEDHDLVVESAVPLTREDLNLLATGDPWGRFENRTTGAAEAQQTPELDD